MTLALGDEKEPASQKNIALFTSSPEDSTRSAQDGSLFAKTPVTRCPEVKLRGLFHRTLFHRRVVHCHEHRISVGAFQQRLPSFGTAVSPLTFTVTGTPN